MSTEFNDALRAVEASRVPRPFRGMVEAAQRVFGQHLSDRDAVDALDEHFFVHEVPNLSKELQPYVQRFAQSRWFLVTLCNFGSNEGGNNVGNTDNDDNDKSSNKDDGSEQSVPSTPLPPPTTTTTETTPPNKRRKRSSRAKQIEKRIALVMHSSECELLNNFTRSLPKWQRALEYEKKEEKKNKKNNNKNSDKDRNESDNFNFHSLLDDLMASDNEAAHRLAVGMSALATSNVQHRKRALALLGALTHVRDQPDTGNFRCVVALKALSEFDAQALADALREIDSFKKQDAGAMKLNTEWMLCCIVGEYLLLYKPKPTLENLQAMLDGVEGVEGINAMLTKKVKGRTLQFYMSAAELYRQHQLLRHATLDGLMVSPSAVLKANKALFNVVLPILECAFEYGLLWREVSADAVDTDFANAMQGAVGWNQIRAHLRSWVHKTPLADILSLQENEKDEELSAVVESDNIDKNNGNNNANDDDDDDDDKVAKVTNKGSVDDSDDDDDDDSDDDDDDESSVSPSSILSPKFTPSSSSTPTKKQSSMPPTKMPTMGASKRKFRRTNGTTSSQQIDRDNENESTTQATQATPPLAD